MVFSEVNLTSIPRHTWWIDFDATTHISVSIQGCLSYQRLSDGERIIYVGDGKSVEVKAMGTFWLLLKTSYCLDLNETYVVLSFSQNLISISILDKCSYCCSFGNSKFSLFKFQILLALVLYHFMITYTCLILLPRLMKPCI